jgi:hypothetical protein
MMSERSSGDCIFRPGASATRHGASDTERSLGTSEQAPYRMVDVSQVVEVVFPSVGAVIHGAWSRP